MVIKKSKSEGYLVDFNMEVGRQENLFLLKKKKNDCAECVWSGGLFTAQWLLMSFHIFFSWSAAEVKIKK